MKYRLIFFLLTAQLSFGQTDTSAVEKQVSEYLYIAYLGNRDFPTYNIVVSMDTIDFTDVVKDSSFTSKMKYYPRFMKEIIVNQEQFTLLKNYLIVQNDLCDRNNQTNQKIAATLKADCFAMLDYGVGNHVYKVFTFYSLPEYIAYLDNLICFAKRNTYPDNFITQLANQRFGILHTLDRFTRSIREDVECY
ncbi:MAG: hypothetical protein V4604_14470 [Bacteroidota bacterium]